MGLRESAHSVIHLLLALAIAVMAAAMPARAIAGQFQSMDMPGRADAMPCGDMGGMDGMDRDHGTGGTAAGNPDADCDLAHCDWTACLGIACLPASPRDRVATAEAVPPGWAPVLPLARTLDNLLRPPIA